MDSAPGEPATLPPAQPGWPSPPAPPYASLYAPFPYPPPPGYGWPEEPTKRGPSVVLAALVGAVAVAAVVVALPILFLAMAPSNVDTVRTEPVRLEMIADRWDGGALTVRIVSVSVIVELRVAELTHFVSAGDGTVLFSGPEGEGDAVSGVAVTVAYVDSSAHGIVSVGDEIRLTVAPPDPSPLHGGVFRVFSRGTEVGLVSLP